ncbi:MAG: M15 family metallopeptidase [Verrucomicrobia bacterium]|nr:M15 family metallopeptidase [Verrucomicrobiota bacterium]
MSTAFVQLTHTARTVTLLFIVCALFAYSSAPLCSKDFFTPSPAKQILKKAARLNLVSVKSESPGIVIDLKYASADNITGRALYPPDMPCLLHRITMARLKRAQKILRKQGLRLKIWDAYRPPDSQWLLWMASKSSKYVVPPTKGPSLHSYGVAVDVTLVDKKGYDLLMPSAHDEFSEVASSEYTGDNSLIRYNLDILQNAMKKAGFSTIKDEWWHFTNMEPQSAQVIYAKQLGILLPLSQNTAESTDSSEP